MSTSEPKTAVEKVSLIHEASNKMKRMLVDLLLGIMVMAAVAGDMDVCEQVERDVQILLSKVDQLKAGAIAKIAEEKL